MSAKIILGKSVGIEGLKRRAEVTPGDVVSDELADHRREGYAVVVETTRQEEPVLEGPHQGSEIWRTVADPDPLPYYPEVFECGDQANGLLCARARSRILHNLHTN